MSLIRQASDLSYHHPGQPSPLVEPDLDLTLYAGDHVALLGANGTGKTTLLRALLGLEAASGEVSSDPRACAGYLPQRWGYSHDAEPGETRFPFRKVSLSTALAQTASREVSCRSGA